MSSHVVTLRNAILEARAALTGATALTDLVPERNITFGNSPQKDRMPRIVIEVSSAEYAATFTQSRKVQTFTVEYAVYSKSVDTCTAIMDEVRQALDTYQSSDFAVRVTDESFQAEVDNILLGVVVATFQDAAGIPGFDTSAAETLAAAQADLAAAQEDLAQAQADLATSQAETQALQDQLDLIDNPPAYNATGQLGENATAIYGTTYLADGYSGPVLQMFDALSHNGTDDVSGYTTVDIYPQDLHNYAVAATSTSSTAADGNRWRVMKVYDQVGTNDLVYDAQEDRDQDGNWGNNGPTLIYASGAYMIAYLNAPHGFISEEAIEISEMTAVLDYRTFPGRRLALGGIYNGVATDGQQPVRAWTMASWGDNSLSGRQTVTQFGGGEPSDNFAVIGSNASDLVAGQVELMDYSGGRKAMAFTRNGADATMYSGANLYEGSTSGTGIPDPGTALKFGCAFANWNATSGLDEGFVAIAIHEGEYFSDPQDLRSVTDLFASRVGNMDLRARYEDINS